MKNHRFRYFLIVLQLGVCGNDGLHLVLGHTEESKHFLLVSLVRFEREKHCKALSRCAVSAVFWCIWMEKYASFNNHFMFGLLLRDKIVFLASLWCHLAAAFRCASLVDILKDWTALLFRSRLLFIFPFWEDVLFSILCCRILSF